ncbi:uncharacterized protein LOC143899065 [Temnothorax americanus]|uniref:uncharacterized protein LOC143899065 n=1 Tax=Temnothorax americanus TaxID=1964332 RepID=UPI00406943D1
MYISEAFNASVVCTSENNYCGKPEYLVVEVSISNYSKILLAVVYRPPHTGFLSDFFTTFSELSANYKHSIMFGDFNADLTSHTYDSEQILTFVQASNFFLVPYLPTHNTRTASTWLDLCIIDKEEKLVRHNQRDVGFLSAHDLIEITYNIKIERIPRRTVRVRDFRSFDPEDFLAELGSQNWDDLSLTPDIDVKVRILNDFLRTCYDKHAPYRVICPKHLPAPWLTPDLRKLMKDRDRTRRVWRRNKTESNYDTYRRLRNLVQLEVRRAKTEYFHKTFHDAKEPNILWKKLRHFGFLRPKAQHDRLVFTPEELNAYFTGHAKDSDPEESIVFDLGEVAYSDQKFYWYNIEPGEIVRALQRSNLEATGRDELPRSLIVRALPCILPALTHIFNYCLSYGVYPSVWRSAVICPIPKVNHPCELHDYRPISILCAVSKALERIVADQITNFLEENDILDPFQSAYRKDFSTQTALIRILDDIKLAADRRKVTIAVLFDFSKAFDNVCPHRLIKKLRRLGFANLTLKWLCSYLTGREQVVRDPSGMSSDRPVHQGVPQGSVLGPLLFLLYLLDFSGILKHCKYQFYADDLVIYLHVQPGLFADAIARINKDIKRVVQWTTENGLKN